MGKDEQIRVCHLISGDLWAGAEVQAYTLMRALRGTPGLALQAVVLNEGMLSEKLREIGLGVAVIDERRYGFMTIKSRLARKLSADEVDILHTHRYKENVLGGLVKDRCGIGGLVQTVHGIHEKLSGLKKLKMKFYMSMNDQLTRNRFSRVIAVSHEIESILNEKFGKDKVATIHNAVDIDSIKPSRSAEDARRELGLRTEQPLIGSVGRLVPVKGYDVFLKSAKLILEKQPEVAFVIVGDGPLRKELEIMARDMGLESNVIFTGFREDVLDLVNALDLFLVTSHHEGIPMSVLEAMALGKAVVSTNVGGMSEIIEDGVSGMLVQADNPGEIASKCLMVVTDRALGGRLGENAVNRIEDEFSTSKLRDRMLRLYREVVA